MTFEGSSPTPGLDPFEARAHSMTAEATEVVPVETPVRHEERHVVLPKRKTIVRPDPAAPAGAEPGERTVFLRILALMSAVWATLWLDGFFVYWGEGKRLTVYMWDRWDAPHFLSIASHGYVKHGRNALWIVFPPAFPFLARAVGYVVGRELVAGLLVSFGAALAAAWFFYKMLRLDVPHDEAWRAIVLLFTFPTAYFLAAPYTESLYLLAVVGAMYAARKNHWGRAGLAGIIATASRLPSVALAPALAIEAIQSGDKRIRKLAWVATSGIGLLVFLGINYAVHHNPLYFLKVEAGKPWWQHVVPPWMSLTTAFGQVVHVLPRPYHTAYWTLYARIGAAIFAVTLLAIGNKRMRLSEKVFAWGTLIFSLSASRLISLPRYILIIYPLYAILAERTKSRTVFTTLVASGFAMQLFLFARFSVGSWTF